MVIECILKAEDAGLGNGETPIFPIHIFKVKEGVNYNPEDPNYDLFKLACRVSAKRLFPNFFVFDAPFNLQYYKEGDYNSEVAYMGCRTRVMANHYDPTREVYLWPRQFKLHLHQPPPFCLAIKANGNVDFFFEQLDRMLDLVCDQLMARYKIQAAKKVRNYPS